MSIALLAAPASATPEAEALADKLMSYRVPGGGILVEPPGGPRTRIVPYFGNFAALGWTETAAVTTDTAKRERYLQAAREWMDWYATNQNSDGTIYDFESEHGSLKPTGEYDSTDSYPATYAMLMWRYYRASDDKAYVQGKAKSLAAAYGAMMLTADGTGLTYAKPGYSRLFLMDNCEVAAGCVAFARLFDLLGEPGKAAEASAALERLKKALPRFYRSGGEIAPATNTFGFALEPYGRLVGTFSKGYPDAMANLFALTFLAEGGDKENALLQKLKTTFWESPDAQDFPQWWLWGAMACGDKDLEQKAWVRLREQAAAPEAHSFLIGLAAATMCSGLESLRYDEVVIPRDTLTSPAPDQPIKPPGTQVAGDGVGLYLTFRGSTSTIVNHGWRALALDLPARIQFDITTSTGYLLANIVMTKPWDLRDKSGVKLSYTASAAVLMKAQVTLVDDDGDWWTAPVPATTRGRNDVQFSFDKLKPNKFGKGNGELNLEAVKGLRLQFDATTRQPVQGEVTLDDMTLLEKRK